MTHPPQHTFTVDGMTCQHCVRALTEAITEKDPACRVEADLAAGTLTVHSPLGVEALERAIEGAGYGVRGAMRDAGQANAPG